ncbi:MAG: 6-phosphofructokinase, partial [Candidatus Methylomirabilis sp.]|nr:6-phosphofructokinase [Deltaproteobacteria bacterium]
MNKIAVLCSGGDAPGMNAAVRAVVRTACFEGLRILGVQGGYEGLINANLVAMDARSVANIVQQGGTILQTSRSPRFATPEGRALAAESIRDFDIEGLVVIGGDGSFRGAQALSDEHGVKVVGVPGTIDNDLAGTDYTIGFDTAVNTALEAIDRIRDTATAHDRPFIVEVMGRDAGYIAAEVALGGGADEILIPEIPFDADELCRKIDRAAARGKKSFLIVAAEADQMGRSVDIGRIIEEKTGVHFRVCILGHVQRGGNPTARDRMLASRLGAGAVKAL